MNTTMTKRICSLLLAVVLACGMVATSGCGSNTDWVYEADGIQVTAGMYINFMMYTLSEMQIGEMNANAGNPDYVAPETKAFLKGYTDGVLNAEKVRTEAKIMAGDYFNVSRLFAQYDLELNQEDVTATHNYTDTLWNTNGPVFEKNGIGRESVRAYQTYLMKKDVVFEHLYGPGGVNAVSDEELRALLATNYAKVEVMTVAVDSTDATTGEADKARAEDYLARYQKGEAIEELDYENRLAITTEEASGTVTKNDAGVHVSIISIKNAAGDELLTSINDMKPGDIDMFLDNYVYFIVKKLDLNSDAEALNTYRAELLGELKLEEFEADMRQQAQTVEMTLNQPAYNRYKPERLTFNAA